MMFEMNEMSGGRSNKNIYGSLDATDTKQSGNEKV